MIPTERIRAIQLARGDVMVTKTPAGAERLATVTEVHVSFTGGFDPNTGDPIADVRYRTDLDPAGTAYWSLPGSWPLRVIAEVVE